MKKNINLILTLIVVAILISSRFIYAYSGFNLRLPLAFTRGNLLNVRFFGANATIDNKIYNIEELIQSGKIYPGRVDEVTTEVIEAPTVAALMGLEGVVKFSFREVAEAVLDFLVNNDYQNLKDIVSKALCRQIEIAEIKGPLDLVFSKYGPVEHVIQLIVRVKNEETPLLIALHAPTDYFASMIIKDDYDNQVYFRDIKSDPTAEPYIIGQGRTKRGSNMTISANEWLVGYLEAHIRLDENDNKFILWVVENGERKKVFTDERESRQIAFQIYKILALYNDINLERVKINAGDFVVKKTTETTYSVKIVTIRERWDAPSIGFRRREVNGEKSLWLRNTRPFLDQLISLQIQEYESGQEVSELPIADFETIFEAFHQGIVERLVADGFLESQQDYTVTPDAIVINALTLLREILEIEIYTPGQSQLTEYVRNHSEEIIAAIDKYLSKIKTEKNIPEPSERDVFSAV